MFAAHYFKHFDIKTAQTPMIRQEIKNRETSIVTLFDKEMNNKLRLLIAVWHDVQSIDIHSLKKTATTIPMWNKNRHATYIPMHVMSTLRATQRHFSSIALSTLLLLVTSLCSSACLIKVKTFRRSFRSSSAPASARPRLTPFLFDELLRPVDSESYFLASVN